MLGASANGRLGYGLNGYQGRRNHNAIVTKPAKLVIQGIAAGPGFIAKLQRRLLTQLLHKHELSYLFDAMGGRHVVSVSGSERRFLVAPVQGTVYMSNFAVLGASGQLLVNYVYTGEHPLMRIDADGSTTQKSLAIRFRHIIID